MSKRRPNDPSGSADRPRHAGEPLAVMILPQFSRCNYRRRCSRRARGALAYPLIAHGIAAKLDARLLDTLTAYAQQREMLRQSAQTLDALKVTVAQTRHGGNVLTVKILSVLPPFDGPKVIFGERCRISETYRKRAC